MKKWAPYASLIEQKGTLAAMRYEHSKIKRPHLSSDQAEIIERKLRQYNKETIRLKYFDDGFIKVSDCVISKIDDLKHLIIIDDTIIHFIDILSIED